MEPLACWCPRIGLLYLGSASFTGWALFYAMVVAMRLAGSSSMRFAAGSRQLRSLAPATRTLSGLPRCRRNTRVTSAVISFEQAPMEALVAGEAWRC
jgi:hypothetical protein